MGYSGHEVGIFPSALAVSLGALAVERHITLDRSSYGTDQPASVEKRGLELLVRDCRSVKEIMGTGIKVPTEKELQIIKKLRDKRKCCLGASQ
jgi:N-acetylneuraminate synthase